MNETVKKERLLSPWQLWQTVNVSRYVSVGFDKALLQTTMIGNKLEYLVLRLPAREKVIAVTVWIDEKTASTVTLDIQYVG